MIIAQTTALNDHVTALNIRNRQLAAAVQLFTGLGGGWDPAAAQNPLAQAK